MAKAYTFLVIAYVTAFAAAGFFLQGYDSGQSLLLQTFYADVLATAVIFIFSHRFRNASFYDPYWSVAPIIICSYWMIESRRHNGTRDCLLLMAFLIWGTRLTLNWARGWKGLAHEDWRYIALRKQTGSWYPLVNFSGIHLFPTVIVFLGMMPAYYAISISEATVTWLDGLAFLLCFIATFIEWLSDEQQRRFRINRKDERDFYQMGLWKYSRHPNYFGEVLFWWGIYLFVLAADSRYWWTVIGPITITLMFIFISIPMMEKHLLEKRPHYADYQKAVSALFPFIRRR